MTYTVYILPSPRTARSGSNAVHRRLKLLAVSVFLRISTSWITSSCLLSCMDFSLTAGPPPRLSSRLPPVLLSESHLTARGHSLGPPRMWQHHAISKVPHLTAPPLLPNKHAAESFTHASPLLLKLCTHEKFVSFTHDLYSFIEFCNFQRLLSQVPFIHSLSLTPTHYSCVCHVILRSFTIRSKLK